MPEKREFDKKKNMNIMGYTDRKKYII